MGDKTITIELDRLEHTQDSLEYIKENLFCKECNKLTLLIDNYQSRMKCVKCDNQTILLTEDDKKHLSNLKLKCSLIKCQEVFPYKNLENLRNHENQCDNRDDSKINNSDESNIHRSKIAYSVNIQPNSIEDRLKKIENFLFENSDSNLDKVIEGFLIRKGLISEEFDRSKNMKEIDELIKNFEIKNPFNYESHIKSDTYLEKLEDIKDGLEKLKFNNIDRTQQLEIVKLELSKIHKDISFLNDFPAPSKYLNTKISRTIKDLELTSLFMNQNHIFVATKNKFIKIFENSRGSLVKEIKTRNLVTSMITISNGELIYGDGGKVMIQNMYNSEPKEVISLDENLLVTSLKEYDNKTIIVGSSGPYYYYLDLEGKKLINTIDILESFNILKLLILKPSDILITGCGQGTLRLYEKQQFKQNLDGHNDAIQSILHLKSDENKLVTSDRLGTIILWDIKNNFKEILRKERNDFLKTDLTILNCEVCELPTKKMLVALTRFTTLTFFNLEENLNILRHIELSQGGKFLLNYGDKMIFNINSNIYIWN